jgi:tRNA nucleotidyltransferase (CCA-adding enzyme)
VKNSIRPLSGAIPVSVREICGSIGRAGGRAYLVGGCVRDLLLGKQPEEWDLEVFGLAAEEILAIFPGRLLLVGKSFGIYRFHGIPVDLGIPRREWATGLGHRNFSIATDPALPLEAAAARRDFTVNAIYLDPLTGEIRDPHDGRKDLEGKRLRAVSEKFGEDPLRVLRAMQFIARFGLTCDGETLARCRKLSPEHLSAERIYGEWKKFILLGIFMGRGLEFLRRCDWLRFFPELQQLPLCPQSAYFHPEGSLWEHVKAAMDAFPAHRPAAEADALAVGFAVLCHDIGKPLCTCVEEDGRVRAKNHESVGVPVARAFLERMRTPKATVEMALALVRWHMAPRRFTGDARTVGTVRRLAREVGRIDLLTAVARCDKLGRPPSIPDLSAEESLEAAARREGVWDRPPKPLLRGSDLLVHCALTPSPSVGRILRQLFEEQLDGKFSTREEGLVRAREVTDALVSP